MSRYSPVPTVVITSTISADSETGSNFVSTTIGVMVTPDTSAGFVTLDEPSDLYILRDTIDKYISNNNIKNPYHMNTEQNQNTENNKSIKNEPRFLGVIEGYINTEWQPTRAFSPNDRRFRIISSQEIVTDLAEMVDIELNDVAAAMMHLGYRTIVVDGKVGWLLEYRAK